MASRKTETRMHDTYIYAIHIYMSIVKFDFIDLRLLALRNNTVLVMRMCMNM